MNRKSYAVLPAAITLTAGLVMMSNVAVASRKAPTQSLPTDTRSPFAGISHGEGGLAGVNFSENFEAGYVAGPGCGQNGWAGYCGPNGIDGFQIQANSPVDPVLGAFTGRHNSDGTGITGFEVQSPFFATLEPGRIDMDIVLSDALTEYQIVTINNGGGFFNTRVHFEDDGVINVLQVTDPACATGVFMPATATWTAGVRFRLGVETDGTTLTIYKDGSAIFTGTDINSFCAPVAPAGIDQLANWAENRVGGLGSNMLIDNIGVGGPACVGDTNGDNTVNVDDLVAVILGWGACVGCPPASCASDIDGDCDTDVDDLVAVILAWGPC